ncbi:hypothetical protein EVAR_41119_1 [Eumeta japonica]|uniref:Uncharacterized protein n=1 Tax=Eumeta variegata TaxID=151549 RepID=A0A4C1XCG4_EUMVA|nr:hypothetical protein EVAR_41119_1 [Eumeta japonica]
MSFVTAVNFKLIPIIVFEDDGRKIHTNKQTGNKVFGSFRTTPPLTQRDPRTCSRRAARAGVKRTVSNRETHLTQYGPTDVRIGQL